MFVCVSLRTADKRIPPTPRIHSTALTSEAFRLIPQKCSAHQHTPALNHILFTCSQHHQALPSLPGMFLKKKKKRSKSHWHRFAGTVGPHVSSGVREFLMNRPVHVTGFTARPRRGVKCRPWACLKSCSMH